MIERSKLAPGCLLKRIRSQIIIGLPPMGLITTPPLACRPPKIEQSRIMPSGDEVGNNLIRYPFLR